MQDNEQLMTKADVAKSLRVCMRTVENLIKSRQLAIIKIGRLVRIERQEVTRLKRVRTVTANQ